MSWAEAGKINNNYKRALNEQLRDLKFQELQIITSTGTYKPTKTGLYKVICVGAGGAGYGRAVSGSTGGAGGGGGGVAIKTLKLSASSSYSVTVNTMAEFVYNSDTVLQANAGADATYKSSSGKTAGTGGTASGGDTNYVGEKGSTTSSSYVPAEGGSVGVFLSGLYTKPVEFASLLGDDVTKCIGMLIGGCVLNYGGGGSGVGARYSTGYNSTGTDIYSTPGKPAAIIIVPLEMDE